MLDDLAYVAWLKIYHPDKKISSSTSSSIPSNQKSFKNVLSKILVLPEPKPTTTRQSRRKTAACITDGDELDKRKDLDEKKQSMQEKGVKASREVAKSSSETESTRRETASANRETASPTEERK